jgi:hypothetical protein
LLDAISASITRKSASPAAPRSGVFATAGFGAASGGFGVSR